MEPSPKPAPFRLTVPTGTAPADVRRRMEAMERLLENSLTIPGTRYGVGLDAIVGLVPVVGDVISAALAGWLVWEARNLGLPKWRMWQMAGNVALDTAVGMIPVVGDAFDLAFRSNTRNMRMVRRHLDRHHPETRVIDA